MQFYLYARHPYLDIGVFPRLRGCGRGFGVWCRRMAARRGWLTGTGLCGMRRGTVFVRRWTDDGVCTALS